MMVSSVRALVCTELPELSELNGLYNTLSSADAKKLAKEMEQEALKMLRRAIYLEERADTFGSHEDGVKAQNKIIRRVRKALDYEKTIDINF